MGGCGASSGISDSGKVYGTEYTTLHKSGNIEFVKHNEGSTTAPLETMTKGRVYVTVDNENDLKSISYYDKNNKRYKQIDLDHFHRIDGIPEKPHTQYGYYHQGKATVLTSKERKMVDRTIRIWQNINR